ncbi:hypothetical protein NPIL_185821 [Nephila pilipes]|uniref:Uncharacterized protein n=1 Tax=Nephila pilipes TaxID=299642 RepID=A0A8X6TJF1_NEPPI|nr:hypothetical protein NPIL_185821 [Nephila pilipes]
MKDERLWDSKNLESKKYCREMEDEIKLLDWLLIVMERLTDGKQAVITSLKLEARLLEFINNTSVRSLME